MEKNIKLHLNKYAVIPHTLREQSNVNRALSEVKVDLAQLFHHYYLDTHGRRPPDPDASNFEHLQFLLPSSDFRFQGAGLGISTDARRSRSSDLGRAFCRWFLHEHLNITYFAHLERVIGRQLIRGFKGCVIEKVSSGDMPDYLCAENVSRVFLAEAKGRYTSIGFGTKEFETWRKQFSRIRMHDMNGLVRAIKGHIVAVRFATEVQTARIVTTLAAEDPQSPGDIPLDGDWAAPLGAHIVASHYAGIAEKLDQPILAAALSMGVALPDEIRVPVVIWRMTLDPEADRRFIGGYFARTDDANPYELMPDGEVRPRKSNPFRLDSPTATFFGVEESIFRQVVASVRRAEPLGVEIAREERTQSISSAISLLRDGSVVGPAEFFLPIRPLSL